MITADFSGNVALVTGGSKGLGKEIARRLLQTGCKVIINYSSDTETAAAVASELGVEPIQADISDYEGCKKMIAEIVAKHGRLDFVVNNAAISRDSTFKKMSKEQWDTVINVDLNSMYNVTHPAVTQMLLQKRGKIVSISSVSGVIGFFGQTNYSAAKAGVIGFTKALAREVASSGITVNAVAPGILDVGLGTTIPEAVLSKFLENIPLRRVGKAQEVADAVIFLLANDYVTGQVIGVNGGLSM